jgi:hypothetical protein
VKVGKSGIDLAQEGLGIISTGDFKSKKKCRDFFKSLISTLNLNTDVDTLMDKVTIAAKDSLFSIFDGPSAKNVALTSDKFGRSNTAGANTVAEWFSAYGGRDAVSQLNGTAIFIRANDWKPYLGGLQNGNFYTPQGPSKYALGTLMHELLHKQSTTGGIEGHEPFEDALSNIGALHGAGAMNDVSVSLGDICF